MTRKPTAPVSARDPDALVAVGYVMRAHGLRGELRLKHLNSNSTILLECKALVLRKPEQTAEARTIAVLRSRREKDDVLAFLEGVASRNDAEALVGLEICVPRAAFSEPAEGEWYIVDLVGLAAQRADGTALGEVLDVVQYPTIDCLRVRSSDGVREVPMVEPYLVGVDVKGGFVTLGELGDLELEEPKKPKVKGPRPRKPTGQAPTDDGAQE